MRSVFLLLAAAASLLSWLMPNHTLPWASWHSEAMAFLAVLVLAWLGLASPRRPSGASGIAFPPATLPFAVLALVAAAQKASGQLHFWGDALVFWLYLALCVVALVLGYLAVACERSSSTSPKTISSLHGLAFILLAAGLISTVIAYAQLFGLWESSEWILRTWGWRRPGANLAQPNHLATLLVMGVASVVFLYQSRRLGGLGCSLLLLVLYAGLAVAESRTGMLSLLLLLGWWLLKRRRIGHAPPAWLGFGCTGVALALFLTWPQVLKALLLDDQAELNTTSSRRLELWSQVLDAIAIKPWLGWGIHGTARAHNAVADRYAVSAPLTYSHNLVLDGSLWWGVPLTALLVAMVGVWLWRRVRATDDLVPWYGLAVALPVAVHSMLEYPFAYAYFLAPAMFAIGATEAALGVRPLWRMPAKPAAVGLALLTVVLAWSAVEYLQIEEDFRVARFESLRIGTTPPDHQRPPVVLFDQLGVLLDDARIVPTPHMSPADMQTVKAAALHYPWSATQYRYALALALNGEQQEAARQLQVMRSQWGDKAYGELKEQIRLAADRYPQLLALPLP